MRGGDGPSPVSASEKLLERIHNDDLQAQEERIEELRQQIIDRERDLALDIAVHPESPWSSRSGVLRDTDYDGDAILQLHKSLYSRS